MRLHLFDQYLLQLHEFIRLHPSIVVESADMIRQLLEKKYIEEEFERKIRILEQTMKKILKL